MALRRSILAALIFLSVSFRLSAQEKDSQTDSLVRLLSAQSMQLIEDGGVNWRKVTGPARFLHNDTFLICDTALWNTSTNEILAVSNVKILQNETVLTGDKLTYYMDRNLAEFRGSLVQLEDKDHNVLRTEYLDYNTKDSVAVFFNGGSMKDADGQIIESVTGTYDSKTKTFTFSDKVNMFSDSIFVKSTSIIYNAARNVADFGYGTDAWSDDNMLSADAGWYDRNREIFLFRNNVHGLSDTQEGWADSLYYYRGTGDIELLGNAQVTDTTRDMSAVAGKMHYTDSVSRLVMTREPAVIGIVNSETEPSDTVYFGADTLIARTKMMFEIDASVIDEAKLRLDNLSVDAVQTYRRKAAEAAAEAAAKAAENDPNRPKSTAKQGVAVSEHNPETPSPIIPDLADSLSAVPDGLPAVSDSLSFLSDSLSVMSSDSLDVQTDSLSAPLDSTKVNFVTAISGVKLYKSDFQIACDSLEYNDIDSLVRMYKKPVVWNEVHRQYYADSLYAVIKGRTFQKASLMSNAFIIVQEDSLYYDQIRSAEMLAYFDSTGALTRFDALGDASAIFYLQEDSVYATVNKSEAKMLYATFRDGDIDRVHYFESAKNDGYPLAQMTSQDRVLKGFDWQPDRRPSGPQDITTISLRASQRSSYAARPRASFVYTDKYFPGYILGIMKQIEHGKIAKAGSEGRKTHNVEEADTAGTASETLIDPISERITQGDSLLTVSMDSLSVEAIDTLSVSDSLTAEIPLKDEKTLKAEQRAAERAAKIAAREARWAQLDSLDAAKAQAKADKKAAKLRSKKLKALVALDDRTAKENARLERYKARYARKKAKADKRATARAAKQAEASTRKSASADTGTAEAEDVTENATT